MQYTENYSMNKPQFGENALVTKLNENADTLDTLIYNTRQMQADTYDSTQTYNTGDLVSYNSALYICLADNVTGAWDSTKWSATTLAEQVELAKQSGGESALADLEDVNITNPSEGQILTYDDANDEWVNTDNMAVTKEVTGNPIELTDAASAPMVKCVTAITGYQSGTGTPSPDNIRPITAYTEGEIEVSGKNLFDGEFLQGYWQGSDGSFSSSNSWVCTKTKIKCEPNTDYVISADARITRWQAILWYDENDEYISQSSYNVSQNIGCTAKSPANAYYMGIDIAEYSYGSEILPSDVTHFQVEKGSTATTYEPYTSTTHTTTYPSAIFRGSEDVVEGEVTSEMPVIDLGDLLWNVVNNNYFYVNIPNGFDSSVPFVCECFNYIGSYVAYNTSSFPNDGDLAYSSSNPGRIAVRCDSVSSASDFINLVTGMKLAYKLPTPTTSSVTPTNLPIKSLSGYNHIESSTGDMEVEYITEEYQPLVDLIQSSNGHTYSTQEQVVGKWIDGSDLYERTITIPNVSITKVESQMYYSIIDLSSYLTGLDKAFPDIDKSYIVMQDDTVRRLVWIDYQSTDDVIVYSLSSRSSVTLVLTMQYTKTTTTRSLSAPVTSQKAQIEPLTDKTEEVPTEEEKAVNEEENNDETR